MIHALFDVDGIFHVPIVSHPIFWQTKRVMMPRIERHVTLSACIIFGVVRNNIVDFFSAVLPPLCPLRTSFGGESSSGNLQ